jgi:hypothetical protein
MSRGSTIGVLGAMLALGGATLGMAASSPPDPDLPSGACGGSWSPPTTVVPLDGAEPRPDAGRGPYPGFNLAELNRTAEQMPGYAGLWAVDRAHSFTMTFVFTTEVEEHMTELRELTHYPGNLEGKQACYSLRDLRQVQRTVAEEMTGPKDPLLPVGRLISATGIDVFSNRAYADLRRHNRRREQLLEERYGPAFCVPRADIAPMAEKHQAAFPPPADRCLGTRT